MRDGKSKIYHVHRFEDSSICDAQFQSSKNGKNDEYMLTLALSISHFLPSEQTHLSSQQQNHTTNFKSHHQSAKMSTHSRSLRALVILILPLTIITLLITTTLLPSNHPISPLSRLSYSDLETDMETLPQHGMRAFNLLVNQMGGRGMGVHFRAPWAGRNAFVPATRLVNTGAMSAFGVGGDVTSMTSPSPSIPTTTTTSRTASQDKVAVLENYQSWIDSQPRSDSEREVLQDMPWLCKSCVLSFMAGKEKQYTSVTTAKNEGAATGFGGVFRGQQEVFEMLCGGSGCSRSARSRDHILM